jgi:NTP pyrophosphatase (non-canonical NTP hydrolase)
LKEAEEEIADVFISIVYLAHKLGIDPVEAAGKKLKKIAEKYPVEKSRGKNLKYTAYQ